MHRRSIGVGSLARAVAVITATLSIATGVTFAALQRQKEMLLNNTIESATADLRIGTSATSFSASRTGFDFKDVVPGGPATPTDGNSFWLKNYGTAKLALKFSVGSIPINAGGVDLTKVSVVISRVDTSVSQTFALQALVDAFSTGGLTLTDPLNGGETAQYRLQLAMASDAFSGQSAAVSDVDMVFSGKGAL